MRGRFEIQLTGAALVVALASGACRETPPAAVEKRAATEKSAPADKRAAAPTIPGTAAQVAPKPGQPDPRVDAMRAGIRRAHFDAQQAVPLPADAPDGLAGLVPKSAKLVEFEIHRRMHLLKPTTRRRIVLRWLTRLEGEAAHALARRTAGMWSGAPLPQDATTARHPAWGALRWSVHTPAERATRVEMVLEADEPEAPPLPAVPEAPWRTALADATIVGFEHGRYHAQRGAGTYTDLERLSAIVRSDDGEGLKRRLEQAVLAAGYTRDDDDPRVLRAPGTARTTFTARAEETRLTVHHQRRWTRRAQAEPGATGQDTPDRER